MLDPNTAPLRALPREDRDLFIAASNGHVLAFDNVSGLPAWISDTLCRLATGGGFAVRQLYSDQDEVLFDAARPVILNGIEDIVTRPDWPIAPCSSASIVYVAVENVVTDRLRRWRPVVVFSFGLLHGLGFAGVLSEIGLSSSHFITGLIAFNVGVELGQLTVIGVCFLAVGLWFGSKTWYRRGITVPASIVIAVISAYWFIERIS